MHLKFKSQPKLGGMDIEKNFFDLLQADFEQEFEHWRNFNEIKIDEYWVQNKIQINYSTQLKI